MKVKICSQGAKFKEDTVAILDIDTNDILDLPSHVNYYTNIYPYLSYIGQQRIQSAYSVYDERTDSVYILNDEQCSYLFNKNANIKDYMNNIKNNMVYLNTNLRHKYKQIKDDALANDRAKYIINKLSNYCFNDMTNDVKKYYNQFSDELAALDVAIKNNWKKYHEDLQHEINNIKKGGK